MSELAEPESIVVNNSEHARLELFMTVVRVAEWSIIVPWYIETLGMVPILIDADQDRKSVV